MFLLKEVQMDEDCEVFNKRRHFGNRKTVNGNMLSIGIEWLNTKLPLMS